MPSFQFQRIVIVGVGLMGGSLGMAVRHRKLAREVVGVDTQPASLRQAISMGAADRTESSLQKAAQDCDLVVLCTPIGRFGSLAQELSGSLSDGTVVTDVGSVKRSAIRDLEQPVSPQGRFVGAHPIAGREQSGVAAASADLFQGAACILTPTSKTDPEALSRVEWFWNSVGCHVIKMDPDQHDQILSAVSHLPHVVAFALVNLLLDLDKAEPGLLDFTAGGFRDYTRIAASSPEVWKDICLANRDAIMTRIENYQKELSSLRQFIESRDGKGLMKLFERANTIKEKLDRPRS